MGRKTLALLTVVCGIFAYCAFADDKTPEPPQANENPSFWMEQKLIFSQKILAGLSRGDFDEIHKNATAMKGLNKVEYFVRREPPEYRTQLRVFQYATDEMIRHAEKSNLDGATLAFAQLTISCVNCHKQLR